jgi:azurin
MKRISSVIIPVFTAFMLVACGGSSSEKKEKSEKNEAASPKKEVVAEKVVVEKEKEVIEITLIAKGEDMTAISYDPKSLTVPAGSRVKLTLKNESVAAGMLHNFVLVNLGTGQEVATAGIKAGEKNNFVPKDPNVLANTEILQMGTSTTIEFDAPAKGSYHYICTYPGHYPNMIGRLNVE